MQDNPTLIPVVAVAIIDDAGRVWLQQRRIGARLGGLWEFPGGKVEPGESPESALRREVAGELGVVLPLAGLLPAAFASDPHSDPARRDPHVILLYSCRGCEGEPRCLDGEAITLLSPAQAAALPLVPLDRALVAQLPRIVAETLAPPRERG